MGKLRTKERCLPVTALIAAVMCFSAQAQTTIPATAAVPTSAADTTKPGFLWRVHQVATSQATTLARTEAQLAGTLGANIADPNAQGAADGVAAEPSPATAPIEFVISRVINLNQDSSEQGNFVPDELMPGIPGTQGGTDNIAAEVLTWLELPVGETIMGVNSDDGFRVTIGGGSPTDPFGVKVGEYDSGRGAADTIFRFNITQAGLYAARLIYNEGGSDASVEWFTTNTAGVKVLVNDVANGGLKAYRAVAAASTPATFTSVSPALDATGVRPNAPVNVQLTEGSAVIDVNTISMTLDGNPATITPTKNGKVITINYTPTAIYTPSSGHDVVVRYTESGVQKSVTWHFTVEAYGTLTANLKVTPDTTKPGFQWNIFQNFANTTTSNQRAEDALAGLLKDAEGNPLPNTADPNAQGVAITPAAAPATPNAPLRFEIAGVINLTQDATNPEDNQNGNFVPDLQMPGLPGGDIDGVAAEILTYIELPAGVVTMGVNSDDGFRTTGGNPLDVFQAIRLGEFDAARGAADTTFSFVVQEAGVYAFRTVWEEGTSGANIEWFTVKPNGSKVLVNDVANGGLKAYRAVQGGTPPYIKAVSPAPINRLFNQPNANLVILIAPGTGGLDGPSTALKIDGVAVTPVTTVEAGTGIVTLTYNPTTLQIPSDEHTAELTIKGAAAGAVARVQQWKFRNLRNIVLPAAVLTEDFDSYEEGSVPTGWVETNFTVTVNAGLDLDNLRSDTYKGWVVVSRDRLAGLKGRIFAAAPGQTVNGEEVTADNISSGNILYAESDVRDGEVQFITSKAFNLSTITNVVMSFSSLYEQNQDNIGVVEYSVDGGNNWLPVIYYIDSVDEGGDIKYKTDGTVDAVLTLTSVNDDTANWVTNGIPKGDKYGDGVAAPITDALGVYIAPRINDNPTVDKRVEVFSLPQAGRKADVRLRFAQIAEGSWYFGVDNIAFYEGPAPVVTPGDSTMTITRAAANQITISWTGSGTLESTDALPGGWDAAASQVNPQTVTVSGNARFYRIRR
jgi:hypothetical protein